MRLDHLLSKEHLVSLRWCPEPGSKTFVLRWELMGGTFDMVQTAMVGAEYIVFTVGKVLVGGVCTCTLLGPEGPDVLDLWVGCRRNLWTFSGSPTLVGGTGEVPPVL